MTLKAIAEKLGSTYELRMRQYDDLYITVTLRDYKKEWGRDRWLVEPVAGSGQVWVEIDLESLDRQ
jgi:hypothetical protein